MEMRQVVQVQILGAPRAYSYEWIFDITSESYLQVGDRVEIPPNMVQEEGASACVSALGSDYNGPMKRIIRRIKDKPAEDDLWAGEDVL